MPLHADDGLELVTLHCLDDVIRRLGCDVELGSCLTHGLMVETVDVHLFFVIHLMEK